MVDATIFSFAQHLEYLQFTVAQLFNRRNMTFFLSQQQPRKNGCGHFFAKKNISGKHLENRIANDLNSAGFSAM